MNSRKYVCQIIEQIVMYQDSEIDTDSFLESTLSIYSIIENEISEDFRKDFHLFWDQIEEIFATDTVCDFLQNIKNEILPNFILAMKKYIYCQITN